MEDTRFNCPGCGQRTENYTSELTKFGNTFYCHCDICGEDWVTFSI